MRILGSFCVLVLVCTCSAAPAWVTGSVYLRDGRKTIPTSKVRVQARAVESGEVVRTTWTDSDGSYYFTDLPPGRILLSASHPGYYARVASRRYERRLLLNCVFDGGYRHNDFELLRGGVISGQVEDEQGEPVQGARIALARGRPPSDSRETGYSIAGLTDDRGMFRISGLEPGKYSVRAEAGEAGLSYEASSVEVEVPPGRESRDVTITIQPLPLFALSGRVAGIEELDSQQIRLLLERLPQPGRKVSTRLRVDGSFDFRIVQQGKYRVSALLVKRGPRRPAKIFLDVIDVYGNTQFLVLRPSPTANLKATVRVISDSPPSRFFLTFSSPEGLDSRSVRVQAPDYRFEIPDLLPGSRYDIQTRSSEIYLKGVIRGDKLLPPRNITFVGGGVAKLEILAAADYGRVYGRVRQRGDGIWLPHARVALASDDRTRSEQADQNGQFLFPNVIPGEYRICAWTDVLLESIDSEETWKQAGCVGKRFQVEPNSQVELDLTAAP